MNLLVFDVYIMNIKPRLIFSLIKQSKLFQNYFFREKYLIHILSFTFLLQGYIRFIQNLCILSFRDEHLLSIPLHCV